MTFLEAAIAILQREGKPLHFKKLTEIALQDNLLTVVGKTPEVTMQQRLNDALKKSEPGLILIREKPGIFGLLRYAAPKAQPPGAAPATPQFAATGRQPSRREEPVADVVAPAAGQPLTADGTADDAGQGTEDRKRRRRRGGRGRRRAEDRPGPNPGTAAADDADGEGEADTDVAQAVSSVPEGDTPSDRTTSGERAVAAPTVAAEAPAAMERRETDDPRWAASSRSVEAPAGEAISDEHSPAVAAAPAVVEASAPRAAAAIASHVEAGTLPRRHSFDAAAAEVADAHRRATQGLPPLPSGARTFVPPSSSAGHPPAERAPHPPRTGASPSHPTARSPESEVHPSPIAAPPSLSPGTAEGTASTTPTPGDAELEELLEDDFDRPSGPTIATAFGTEEIVRGDEHREPYDERRGRTRHRRDRERDRGDRKREGRPAASGPSAGAPPSDARRERRDAPPPPAPAAAARPSAPRPSLEARPAAPSHVPALAMVGNPIDPVRDVLRTEGKTLHMRQIVESALKRKLVRGEPVELARQLRLFVVADAREREEAGLRARVRILGGGNYAMPERKLEGEVYHLEREIGERALRLSDATRATLLRRIARLGAAGFEAMMRVLVDRMGVSQVELVKRGDGVAYYGGERSQGSRRRKVLIAMRPDEVELSRRAVAELRMGLKARGYEEGLLLACGVAGAEALAELAEGAGPVQIHDGDGLAALCLAERVGSMRRSVPIDVLDLEFFSELAEP